MAPAWTTGDLLVEALPRLALALDMRRLKLGLNITLINQLVVWTRLVQEWAA